MREFPWWQQSIFKRHFADKEFLFHLFLLPFTFGDLLQGAKVSAVILATLILLIFYWVSVANGLKAPWLWTALLLASGPLFLYRLSLPRPHLLSIILSFLGMHFILNGRYLKAALLSMIYALSYTASHTLLILALFDDINRSIQLKRLHLWGTLWVGVGLVLGFLLHPNFPANLFIWYYQNILVLAYLWQGIPLNFGAELYPQDTKRFLLDSLGIIIPTILGCYLALIKGRAIHRKTSSLFLAAMSFLLITWLSKRFVEYWVPFTLFFCGHIFTDLLEEGHPSPSIQRITLMIGGTLLIIALGYRSYVLALGEMKKTTPPRYQAAAQWLKQNTPPGSLVYTTDWDDFPELFFYDTYNRYLVGLDPTFMYSYDRENYRLWRLINSGKITTDPYPFFLEVFQTPYLLTDHAHGGFIRLVENHPSIVLVYSDRFCKIYKLLRR